MFIKDSNHINKIIKHMENTIIYRLNYHKVKLFVIDYSSHDKKT